LKRGKKKKQSDNRVSWSNTNTFETYDSRGEVSERDHDSRLERNDGLTGDTFESYDTRGEVSESDYNSNEDERDGGLIDDFNLIYNGDTEVTYEDSTVGGLTHRGADESTLDERYVTSHDESTRERYGTSHEESTSEQYETLTYDDGTWDGSLLESKTFTFDEDEVVVSIGSELGGHSAVSSNTIESPEESIEQNCVEEKKMSTNPKAKPKPSKQKKTTSAKPASEVPPAPLKRPGTPIYLAACESSGSENTDVMDRYGFGEEDNRTLQKPHQNEPKHEEAHQPVVSSKPLGIMSAIPSKKNVTVPVKVQLKKQAKKKEKKKKNKSGQRVVANHSSTDNPQSAPFTVIQPNVKKAKEEAPKVKKSNLGFTGIFRSFASKGVKKSKNATVDENERSKTHGVASPPPRLSSAKEEALRPNHPVKRRVWKSTSHRLTRGIVQHEKMSTSDEVISAMTELETPATITTRVQPPMYPPKKSAPKSMSVRSLTHLKLY